MFQTLANHGVKAQQVVGRDTLTVGMIGDDDGFLRRLSLIHISLVLVFRQWLARHIRWTVALTALCDVLLFWDELFYYESFGLFAGLILVQLAATGAAAFRIYTKQRKD